MQSLSRSTLLGLVRRLRLSSPPSPGPQSRRLLLTASAPPLPPPVCCPRPAAARGRDARTMAVALVASPDRTLGRESRSEEKGALKDVPAAAILKNRNDNEKKRSRRRKHGITILKNSRHRDGSIFKGTRGWKIDFRIANPDETQFEAMMLSDPGDCKPDEIACVMHEPCPMLQIFSLKLAKTSIDRGPIELYGYVAVRDLMDPLRNYVVRHSRDDTIAVKPGSLIEMTGPKRGIKFCSSALIEYDMRIKIGEQEDDDIQLIDGVLGIFDDLSKPSCKLFRSCIDGVGGAVDITVGLLPSAVEATFEVAISEVQSCFDLTVCSYAGGLSQQFKIFQGTIGESCGLRRSVVALMLDGMLHLRFIARRKGCKRDHEIACSIRGKKHGSSTHQLNTELASFLVKTWQENLFPIY
uniref:DUF6598 domain-containing protein n=1 Tax=Oryza punctata TaxID=4537 RepID=A0A0E0M6J9_ORYPU